MAGRGGLGAISHTAPTPLLVPATPMPVPAQVGGVGGYHDEVPHAGGDLRLTARAGIRLAGLVRLDGFDDLERRVRIPGAGSFDGSIGRHHRERTEDRRGSRALGCGAGTLAAVSFLEISDDGPIRTITMSNPGAMNAVPADAWTDLADAFEAFDAGDARVLVITGANGEFCAGADMRRSHPDVPSAAENVERMRTTVNRAALALHRTDKPTIAAVDGVAVGAGMNLAIGCDVVIATDRARFAEVFVRRGLTLDFGGTWLLPRLVGLQRARELALTGRVIGADEALGIGLVTDVVGVDDLTGRVEHLARELAAGAPLAQAFIKRALDRSSAMTFEQALAYEEFAQGLLLASEDLREGARAFVEKRPPDFRGR